MSPPTRFSESNALLAIQAGERIEARRILSGMLPHELRQLAEAARTLAWEADHRGRQSEADVSEFPEAATLRRARLLWDAQRANPPLSIGKRPFRCIGGPLHGATVRLDPGQSRYVAVEPRDPRAFYGADDLPDPYGNLVHYRMAKFGSGTHQMAITVMLAESVPEGDEALPLLLDAFMPEMLTAYEAGEDG